MLEAAAPPASPTRDRELRASLLISAPREQVFATFLDPARLARWWGPRDFPNESPFADVDPPGRIAIRHLSAPRFDLVVTLAPEGNRTRVGWVQRFETAAVCEQLRPLAGPGNRQNLERLEAEVLAADG